MSDQAFPPRPDDGTAVATAPLLADAVHSSAPEDLLRAAADPALTEDLTLALLKRPDLPAEILDQLAKNRAMLKSRKVKIGLACHPHTPRRISVPLVRQFYTFDLMKVALSPVVPADVKLTADEALIARLKMIGVGERLTLARQGSGRIAGALLLDADQRVMRAALENARLTEAPVVQAVLNPSALPALIHEVSRHEKWSYRRDVQIALLRSAHLSLARALVFAASFSPAQLREILANSRLPHKITEHLLRESHNDSSD
jgi:hypothetical protein